eukprot:CAMPEP_0115002626 /NCGR_PEP_ID=MMETSP0216-20121206/18115_1 /TAXON_ID=223996 /ORGANISM="Protocruzia adherens, Strain Boccale" /LENGTH=555 /DNA_ID=CAMNT_0002368251 /DNA_START=111 /DNA_END=1778 /DNA_ORIENTATION=-
MPKRFSYMPSIRNHQQGVQEEDPNKLSVSKPIVSIRNSPTHDKSPNLSILSTKSIGTGSHSGSGGATNTSHGIHRSPSGKEEDNGGKPQELGNSLIATMKALIHGKDSSPSPSPGKIRERKQQFSFIHRKTTMGPRSLHTVKRDNLRRGSAMAFTGEFNKSPQGTPGSRGAKRISPTRLRSKTRDLDHSHNGLISKSSTITNEVPTIRMLGEHKIESPEDLEPVLQHMRESDLERLVDGALGESDVIHQDDQEESHLESRSGPKKYKPSLSNNFSDFRRREIRNFMPLRLNTTLHRSIQESMHNGAGHTISIDINIKSPNNVKTMLNVSDSDQTEHRLMNRLAPKAWRTQTLSSPNSGKKSLKSIGRTLHSGSMTTGFAGSRKFLFRDGQTKSHGTLAPLDSSVTTPGRSINSVYAPKDVQSSIPFLSSHVGRVATARSVGKKSFTRSAGSESTPILPRVHVKQAQRETGGTHKPSTSMVRKRAKLTLKKQSRKDQIGGPHLSRGGLGSSRSEATMDIGYMRRVTSSSSSSSSTSVLHKSVYSSGSNRSQRKIHI